MSQSQPAPPRHDPWFRLILLSFVPLLVHGYHLGVDDAEIYLPAVKKIFDPALFPFDSQFFLAHERLSVFARLVGDSARLLHLSVDAAIFGWYLASIFLLLLAGWRLARACFESERAQWSAVILLGLLFTVPVAGTALPIADPYLTARSFSTPLTMLGIAAFLESRRMAAVVWLLLTAMVHPQMGVYGAAFVMFLGLPLPSFHFNLVREREPEPVTVAMAALMPAALPHGWLLQPAQSPYREVLFMRTFFFPSLWHWYEWMGVIAPLAILYAFAHVSFRGTRPAFARVSRTLVYFGVLATAAFLLLGSSSRFENFVRLQPMRAFHLLYIAFFVFLGGLIGEYLLRERRWPALVLYPAVTAGMLVFALLSYPHSRHIEWPGAAPKNAWLEAFYWVRDNTPKDAVFALDPNYMAFAAVDQHGFRAVAERSALADSIKDSGPVSLFPEMAEDWGEQQAAQRGWGEFQLKDYQRLAHRYGVSWVIVQPSAARGLTCPYHNSAVSVCTFPVATEPNAPAAVYTVARR